MTIADSSAQISIAVNGADLVVTVDGVATSRPIASVAGLTITGAQSNAVSIDLGGGAISMPVVITGSSSLSVGPGAGSDYSYDGSGVSVTGGGIASISLPSVTAITAGGLADTLHGPGADSIWKVTGSGAGVVGDLGFSGFENLAGAANNEDTFVVAPGGSISGVVDGGPGGFDSLVVQGAHGLVVSVPTGPHSGLIALDGQAVHYDGLEPITLSGTTDVSVAGSSGDDALLVTSSGGTITVASTTGSIESVSFATPSGSLTIDGGGGNDSVTIAGDLIMPGANLTVSAEKIIVNAFTIDLTGGSADGSLTFAATDSQTGSNTLGVNTTANAEASITITGATLKAGNVDLESSATSTPAGPSSASEIATIVASAIATLALTDSQLQSSANTVLSTTANVNATAPATGDGSHLSTSVDAAVAVATITSKAITQISGTSSAAVAGSLAVTATNVTSVTSTGDASTAGGGAGIAVANIDSTTKAFIDSSSSITAASVSVSADSDDTVTTTGKASPNGSSANSSGSPSSQTNNNATTTGGAVAVAGALAFSRLSSTTEAYVAPLSGSIAVTTSGQQKIHAGSKKTSTASADGSTVSSGGTGVGVAVAVNTPTIATNAYVAGTSSLHATKLTVEALMPSTGTFKASSTSGEGAAGSVGAAGSLAVNIASVTGAATVAGDMGGGDVALTSTTDVANTAEALPKTGGGGASTGIGASLALNIANTTSRAGIDDGASLTGAHDLDVHATSTQTDTTHAKNGAAGGTAVTPDVATTFSNVTTSATIGTGATLTLTGDLTALAEQTATVVTNAEGDAVGSSTAVGAGLALSVSNHHVVATSNRDLVAGHVSFAAKGTSSVTTTATASASGANGEGGGSPDVNAQIGDQRTLGDTQAAANSVGGSGSTVTPAANTSGGPVTVAAAIAVSIANSVVSAAPRRRCRASPPAARSS